MTSLHSGRTSLFRRRLRATARVRALVAGLSLSLLATGCDQQPAAGPADADVPAAAAPAAPASPPERGSVELVKATGIPVQIDEELRIVDFEVTYQFTSGAPVKHYLCEIAFPGTDRWGVKPFLPNELQPQGVFRTKIEVGDAPVREFEMTLSEADSPDRGFHLVSNKLTGTLQTPETQPEPESQADSQ